MITETLQHNIALQLDKAATECTPIPQFSSSTEFSVEDAYRIQNLVVQQRVARGHTVIGLKMGFTSRAKMTQMGISDLIWGGLTSDMRIEEGSEWSLSAAIHPRIEPEIAFLLKRPLSGSVSAAEALSAVEAIAPALEIIDSRYRDFRFNLQDVIADNASSSGIILGAWHSPHTDISNLGMCLSVNGAPRQLGSTAAILGNPVRSLVAAARLSAAAGRPLKAGDVVMAGAASAAEPLSEGWVELRAEGLGSTGFHVLARDR